MTVLNRIQQLLGLEEEYDEDLEYSEEEVENSEYEESNRSQNPRSIQQNLPPNYEELRQGNKEVASTNSKVVGMRGIGNNNSEVTVIEPQSFEEMPQVIQALRSRKSVVLNLNIMNPEEAQRAVDFVAGGTYAMDGHQQRIGESIFLFTPSCVKVSTLSEILHDVDDLTNAKQRRQTPSINTDLWQESTAMG